MEEEKHTYGLLPLICSSHIYQVGKVKFHVASYFTKKTTIEERLAYLMIEDLYEEDCKKDNENK